MPASVVDQASDGPSAIGTTVQVTAPAGATIGRLLLLGISNESAAPAVTTPSGWTQLQAVTSEASAREALWVGYRVADEGTEDDPLVTHGSGRKAWGMVVITDSQGATGIVSASDNGPVGASATIDAPTVTPSAAGLHLTFYAGRDPTNGSQHTWTPATGYTERVDVCSSQLGVNRETSVMISDQSVAGVTGAVTGTASEAVAAGCAISVAVLDAAAGSVPRSTPYPQLLAH